MRLDERSRRAPEQLMIIGNQKLDSAHFLTLPPAGMHGTSYASSGVLSNKTKYGASTAFAVLVI
jgi:hypothetical protein